MDRKIFEQIAATDVGKIFLLNLADSVRLKLIDKTHYDSFVNVLDKIHDSNKVAGQPWWEPAGFGKRFLASSKPHDDNEQLVRITTLRPDQELAADPEAEFLGEPIDLNSDVTKQLIVQQLNKPVWWVTAQDAIKSAKTSDDVRDILGLDYANAGRIVYRLNLHVDARSKSSEVCRPSALSMGSNRFRACRDDERVNLLPPFVHNTYKGWGNTVNLAHWRKCKTTIYTPLFGAPEMVMRPSFSNEQVQEVLRIGEIKYDSQCDDSDHKRYVKHLNDGKEFEGNTVYDAIMAIRT